MKALIKNRGAEVYINHYNWHGEALLSVLMEVCKRVGVSGGKLKSNSHFREIYQQPDALAAFYLKGVLLAKLERQKPPFQSGDKVITTGEDRVCPRNGPNSDSDILPPRETVKIVRVHYDGNDTWRVEIEGHPGLLYRAEDFVLAPPTDNPPNETA